MGKYKIVVLLALITGAFFALYVFSNASKEESPVLSESYKVTMFQLGVYASSDSAAAFAETTGGIVLENDDFYRVYSAMYTNENLINNLKTYYEENNIDYIIREEILSIRDYEELKDYETLMLRSNNIEVILKANEIILEKFVLS